MGKVEDVISAHELQLNSEAEIRITWTGYFEGILSQLEHMRRVRERCGDLIGISNLERAALSGERWTDSQCASLARAQVGSQSSACLFGSISGFGL